MPTLPISTALREALPESISELYSRDVETMSDADIDRIIEHQRANRERMQMAEATATRAPRATGTTSARRSLDVEISEETKKAGFFI